MSLLQAAVLRRLGNLIFSGSAQRSYKIIGLCRFKWKIFVYINKCTTQPPVSQYFAKKRNENSVKLNFLLLFNS